VIVPIPGSLSPDHLADNVAAVELALSAEEIAQLSSYRTSQLDVRELARRFVPPRYRRAAVTALKLVRRVRS
jgi:diketogulonate reductase-like aldo/keto reductase